MTTMKCTNDCRVETYRRTVIEGYPDVVHCPGCATVGEPVEDDE